MLRNQYKAALKNEVVDEQGEIVDKIDSEDEKLVYLEKLEARMMKLDKHRALAFIRKKNKFSDEELPVEQSMQSEQAGALVSPRVAPTTASQAAVVAPMPTPSFHKSRGKVFPTGPSTQLDTIDKDMAVQKECEEEIFEMLDLGEHIESPSLARELHDRIKRTSAVELQASNANPFHGQADAGADNIYMEDGH